MRSCNWHWCRMLKKRSHWGAPDRRPASLTDQFLALCDALAELPLDNGPDLARDDLPLLRAFAPQVSTMSAQLAATGFPDTLHHDDLHPGNICLRAGQYVVFDWGECGVAHPFSRCAYPCAGHASSVECLTASLNSSPTHTARPGELRCHKQTLLPRSGWRSDWPY